MHLELDDNGGLVVVAPAHWSNEFIRQTLARNMARVERFLAAAGGGHLPPLRYVAGEKHLYLGQAYRLVTHAAGPTRAAVTGKEIHVWAKTPLPERIRAALQGWYRLQAGVVFQDRLVALSHRTPWMRGKQVELVQRRMKRTWGNCSSGGLIKLNTHLVKAPVDIIDSVVAHELCHLEEMNHGSAFYALLEQLNPGWKQDRACLKSKGPAYLRT